MNINSSVLLSKYIKAYTLKMVSKAKASHVGGGLSISDILAVLYNNILYFDSQKPLLENRDCLLYTSDAADEMKCVDL